MKMFNEGGLKDEGGEVDPVSGNDVPIGSTKEEVRDDIPAMVSEGEFIFPADVVRYIGLENLMRLRQDAKMGLKKMEAMGQMGNGDEATIPDDMPFDMADIVIVEGPDEPKEMAQGGVVQAQTGTFVTPMFDPSAKDTREYKNEKGESLFIPFLNGEPVYPIPAGYSPVGQAPTETTPETPAPAEDNGGGGDDKPRVNAFTEAGSWAGAPLDMYIKEAEKVSAYGNMAAGATAALNPVIGAFVFGALKNEKRKLNNTIDARIKEAEKAGLTDSVAALKAVKKRMSPEGQSVLEKAQSTVVDAFKSLLGIEKGTEEAAKVDKAIVNAGKVNDKTSDADVEKLAKVSVEDTFAEDMLSAKAETDEGTRFAYPDITGPSGIPEEPDITTRMSPDFAPEEPDITTRMSPIAPKADEQGDALSDLRAYMQSITNPETALTALTTVQDTMSTFSSNMKGPMQFTKPKSKTEEQTDIILESAPTTIDTTSAGVIADKPDLSAAQETKNKKRRKKQRRERQKAASKALSSFDKNVAKVKKDAGLKNKAAQAGIKKEADKIKSKLEQQEKGIITGFAKGGLASRRK